MSISNKLRLLKNLWFFEEGAKGNADLAGQIVFEFSESSREQVIKDWAKTPTGLRYLAGERLTDNIERFKDRDPNTLGAKYLQFLEKYDFLRVFVYSDDFVSSITLLVYIYFHGTKNIIEYYRITKN